MSIMKKERDDLAVITLQPISISSHDGGNASKKSIILYKKVKPFVMKGF